MSLIDDQKQFYGGLYAKHGDDPRSLSWRDRPTQEERFARIARMFDRQNGPFTVHEIGCGLGHFGGFLAAHHPRALYSGSDIVPEFVESCRQRFPGGEFFERDIAAAPLDRRYDYVALSGTFNARLVTPAAQWDAFIKCMLDAMYALCTRAFAVNFLTGRADPALMQEHLHYQGEAAVIDHIVSRLSRHYELDHAGPLFEFTVRVYRPTHVRSLYPEDSFAKYFRNLPPCGEPAP
jgi:SAM-dependent methyltransferase